MLDTGDLSDSLTSVSYQSNRIQLKYPTILLAKMENYGMRGTVQNWFASYLTNRQLRVKCQVESEPNYQYSDLYDVEFGTPQGS